MSDDGVQSVRRTLQILRLVACGQEQGVRMSDIAAMSGLARPTVHRLLKVLVQETAVEQDPGTRRYLIGPELSLLGLTRASSFPIRTVAQPYLRSLAAQVGDAVFLSVRHGADSVCIGRTLGGHAIQVLAIDVGVRRPLGASVSGIVLLAGLKEDEARLAIRANGKRLSLVGIAIDGLQTRVDEARAAGYTYAEQGVMKGSSALAVPIHDPRGDVVAAISIAALGNRLDRSRFGEALAAMKQQSAMVTGRLAELERARHGQANQQTGPL